MEHEITVLHAEQIAAPPALSPVKIQPSFGMPDDFREHLRQSLGRYCVCEFMPGDGQYRIQEGILREVGQSYLMLYREDTDTTTACEFSSLKFITCYGQGRRPLL